MDGGGEHAGYDAVVLAGGAGRRLGGVDKPALRVGGTTLLDRVLDACAGAATTVVVGPRRPTARPVAWVREDPAGGGPLAALAAGLAATRADVVLLLAADLPFVTPSAVAALLAALREDTGGQPPRAPAGTNARQEDTNGRAQRKDACAQTERKAFDEEEDEENEGNEEDVEEGAERQGPGAEAGRGAADGDAALRAVADGAVLVDPGGRDQPLLAVYRAEALRRELTVLGAEHGSLTGLPLRLVTGRLNLVRLSDPGGVATFDTDTWQALAAARARIREHGRVLDEWIAAVKADLGIDLDVDTATLLDLARDAAHGVARPAAPLTTFLVGYAAGRAGGGTEAVASAAREAAALARCWEAESTPDTAEGGGPTA